MSVVADLYLAGVSTRRVEKASDLDEIVSSFRSRPLDSSPYPFVMLDALVIKVRESGRIVNACVVHATAVNHDGYRESLGLDIRHLLACTAFNGSIWCRCG